MTRRYKDEIHRRELVCDCGSDCGMCSGRICSICFRENAVRQTVEQSERMALYAVTKAEKELGGGTGQIKLRYVYDMFVARFTWLARVISFETFSMMVDEALERMKKMLESNKAMQTLVSGEAGETVEKDM